MLTLDNGLLLALHDGLLLYLSYGLLLALHDGLLLALHNGLLLVQVVLWESQGLRAWHAAARNSVLMQQVLARLSVLLRYLDVGT